MEGNRAPTEQSRNHVVAVVVTYHPEAACVGLIDCLATQCAHVVVVDNGSTSQELAPLRQACAFPGRTLVEVGFNAGIAAAQNLGVRRARDLGATHVLLSDDDSKPAPDMVELLLRGMRAASSRSPMAAVGPLVGEEKPGGDQLVYVSRTWGPRRASASQLAHPVLSVPFLIASGCLIDLRAFDAVGPMDEELFIDHVDLQWGLRARKAGYGLAVVTRARMTHSLGDATVHLPGRAQPVHVHGPIRNYYLTRNTLLLVKSGLLPRRWMMGYLVWLVKYVAFNVLMVGKRKDRLRMVVRGILDGLRGQGGPYRTRVGS